jgi:hypothetical protein
VTDLAPAAVLTERLGIVHDALNVLAVQPFAISFQRLQVDIVP